MGSVSEQGPLDPNDLEFYAPRDLRETLKSRSSSLLQGGRSEPIRFPVSLDPKVLHEPDGLAGEDRRSALFSVAVRFAAAVVVVSVVALIFVIMRPASLQPNAGSTPTDITGSTRTALSPSGQGDDGSKPALAEFRAMIGSTPATQPATHEQSEQFLQQFLQWRQKANSTETPQ
jgi:hypothetical protein